MEIIKPSMVDTKITELSHEELIKEVLRLRTELIQAKSDVNDAVGVIRGICMLFGIMDPKTGAVVDEIKEGGSGMWKVLLAAVMDLMGDLTRAKLPKAFGGEAAQKQLAEKFAFLKVIVPLMERYGAHVAPSASEGNEPPKLIE